MARSASGMRGAHQVRIIGGRHRGRKLPVLDQPGLRPTPDRVRETLFNWLGQTLNGWRCLDLFAGSGALGFEALSRGAAQVIMVEQSPRVARHLQMAATVLNASEVTVVCADALTHIQRLQETPFDGVFLDPPYGQGWLDRVLPVLRPLLADQARIYIESENALPEVMAPDLVCLKRGQAGQVHYHLYLYQPTVENASYAET